MNIIQTDIENIINDPVYQSIIDVEELEQLKKDNSDILIWDSQLDFGKDFFSFWQKRFNENDRRGEVVLWIENLDKKILLHTKPYYPNNIYRLLTGGIHFNETVVEALFREIWEETSFTLKDFNFNGIIFYKFKHNGLVLPFCSYIYKISNIDKEPVTIDDVELITGFKWIEKQELKDVNKQFAELGDDWKDWADMRIIAHEFVFKTNE